jgi:hypothetical protein
MTPDQVSALTAISAIISQVGTWPIGALASAIIFGPWIAMWFVSRTMEKRHEAALKMYETNVKLVENYSRMASEQADTIRLATAATVELTTWLKTRTPCHALLAARLNQQQ